MPEDKMMLGLFQ